VNSQSPINNNGGGRGGSYSSSSSAAAVEVGEKRNDEEGGKSRWIRSLVWWREGPLGGMGSKVGGLFGRKWRRTTVLIWITWGAMSLGEFLSLLSLVCRFCWLKSWTSERNRADLSFIFFSRTEKPTRCSTRSSPSCSKHG